MTTKLRVCRTICSTVSDTTDFLPIPLFFAIFIAPAITGTWLSGAYFMLAIIVCCVVNHYASEMYAYLDAKLLRYERKRNKDFIHY